eukprot:COSAG01_NODE_33937_length_556_cov_0.770241_1_plen_56_part_01
MVTARQRGRCAYSQMVATKITHPNALMVAVSPSAHLPFLAAELVETITKTGGFKLV